jgi:CDP-glucose 4,6-dehydratase
MGIGTGAVEGLVNAFRGRRVFVTGHTGFKGCWLTLWLEELGAQVSGYALAATDPSMFRALELEKSYESLERDVRDVDELTAALDQARPDFIFHLAAQSLVLTSYQDPLATIHTNVLGTANLLEALRRLGRPCVAVIVTSDKCYENREWDYAYRENEAMGGHDVYSMSKGAAELVVASYRRSFFVNGDIRVASARAGNVIGGGDWAENRIVPDSIRALSRGAAIDVRNPHAIRPWQHVLEPLSGYLRLATRLAEQPELAEAWNFGPFPEDARTVGELAERVIHAWGDGTWTTEPREQPHEAGTLRLAIDKAMVRLQWRPRWRFDDAVDRTVAWYKAAHAGATAEQLRELTRSQIRDYLHG